MSWAKVMRGAQRTRRRRRKMQREPLILIFTSDFHFELFWFLKVHFETQALSPPPTGEGFSQCQFLIFPFLVPISQSNNGQATLHNLKHEFNFWGFNSSLGRPVNRSWSHIFWENLTLNAFPSDRGIIWSANSNVSRNIVLLVHCLDVDNV